MRKGGDEMRRSKKRVDEFERKYVRKRSKRQVDNIFSPPEQKEKLDPLSRKEKFIEVYTRACLAQV